MPSEPSDGIFDAPAVYGRGAGAVKYPNRHSRQHRNLETRPTIPQSRNPSDNTAISKPVRQYRNLETRPTTPQSRNPSFPRRRESGPVRTETYRIKRLPKPRVLDSHFRGNDGSVATAR
ncbi:TPA: hypothetical protein WM162_001094 [Neisseria gonorrhoeae]